MVSSHVRHRHVEGDPHRQRRQGPISRSKRTAANTWLPGQVLDRNSAITAMLLADLTAEEDLHEDHRLWPHVQGWAEELGLSGPEAVVAASQPPGDINREQEQAGRQPDREAAD